VAVFALIEDTASSTPSTVLPTTAAANFTVAISSMKFSGDMQWTYERNIEAALDAAAEAGGKQLQL
jgi:hypothetical protein